MKLSENFMFFKFSLPMFLQDPTPFPLNKKKRKFQTLSEIFSMMLFEMDPSHKVVFAF